MHPLIEGVLNGDIPVEALPPGLQMRVESCTDPEKLIEQFSRTPDKGPGKGKPSAAPKLDKFLERMATPEATAPIKTTEIPEKIRLKMEAAKAKMEDEKTKDEKPKKGKV